MRFGVTLGVDLPPNPADIAALAGKVEQLGFDSFWLGDHIVIPREMDRGVHRKQVGGDVEIADKSMLKVYEPLITMGWLAAHVRSIRLGFHVLVIPYRNPVLCAKMLATLDVLTEGRLVLGAGAGWMAGEFEALQVDYQHRGRITDEYLRVIMTLWQNEHPQFSGEFYNLPDVAFLPKPVQRPCIPILIGGNSDAALRRAAELGQGWIPLFQPPEQLKPKIDRLTELCNQRERSIDEMEIAVGCRVRLTGDVASPSSADGWRETVRRYADVGVHEITLVIVEPDLHIGKLHEKLTWFAEEVLAPSRTA
jgi:probable F420-dependent oxidoreductase